MDASSQGSLVELNGRIERITYSNEPKFRKYE